MSSLSLRSQVTQGIPKFREHRRANWPTQLFSLKVPGRAFLTTKKSYKPWKCYSLKPIFGARLTPINAYFHLTPLATWAAKTLQNHPRQQKVGLCNNSMTLHELDIYWPLCPIKGWPKFFEPSGVNQPLCRPQVVLDSVPWNWIKSSLIQFQGPNPV